MKLKQSVIICLIGTTAAVVEKWSACKGDNDCDGNLICCPARSSDQEDTTNLCGAHQDTMVPNDQATYGGWSIKCGQASPTVVPSSADSSYILKLGLFSAVSYAYCL